MAAPDVNVVTRGNKIDVELEAAQFQRLNLSERQDKLVNWAHHSDLEFVCKDGIRVKASKQVLRGNSAVFDKLLASGTHETPQSVIILPEISSSVLLFIFEILYAGHDSAGGSAIYPLVSWRMGLEAASAAHFLHLPNVSKMVSEYLWTQVMKMAEGSDCPEAASMLTSAMELKCILFEGEVVLLKLVRLLKFKWMQAECIVNLSEEALDYILRNTKPKSSRYRSYTYFSLDEYFRVRGAVLWSLCQSKDDFKSAAEAEKFLNHSMPLSRNDIYRIGMSIASGTEITWLPNRDEVESKDEKLREILSKAGCKDAIITRLLTNTNLLQVHGSLLVKSVGPLLPLNWYIHVLESHADDSRSTLLHVKWIHGSMYDTESIGYGNGYVLQKTTDETGCAIICSMGARSPHHLLQWRFNIDSIGTGGIELGLAFGELGSWFEDVTSGKLSDGNCSKVCMIKVWYSTELESVVASAPNRSILTLSDVLSDSAAVSFTCNQTLRCCTVSIDGVGQFSTCGDLPQGKIFPAVFLADSGDRVCIEFVAGFTLL